MHGATCDVCKCEIDEETFQKRAYAWDELLCDQCFRKVAAHKVETCMIALLICLAALFIWWKI